MMNQISNPFFTAKKKLSIDRPYFQQIKVEFYDIKLDKFPIIH